MQRKDNKFKKMETVASTDSEKSSSLMKNLDQLLDNALDSTKSHSSSARDDNSMQKNHKTKPVEAINNECDNVRESSEEEEIEENISSESEDSVSSSQRNSENSNKESYNASSKEKSSAPSKVDDGDTSGDEDSLYSESSIDHSDEDNGNESDEDVSQHNENQTEDDRFSRSSTKRPQFKSRLSVKETNSKVGQNNRYQNSCDDTDTENEDLSQSVNDLKDILDKAIVKETRGKQTKKTTSARNQREKRRHNENTDTDDVFNIFIHSLENSESYPGLLSHPAVEIYICSTTSGELIRKSNQNRSVTSIYENRDIQYIVPVMTKIFDMKKNRSLFCQWNEELLFNESVKHLTSNKNDSIVFFNLKDFSGCSDSSKSKSQHKGWRTFAWAFLKVISVTGQLNVDKLLKLQLYKPRKYWNVTSKDIHKWWKSGSRRKYMSSLKVSINTVTLEKVKNAFRSECKLDGQVIAGNSPKNQTSADFQQLPRVWSRNITEQCQIPHLRKLSLPTFEEGCMVVKYSHNGLLLAAATTKYLLIFDVDGNLIHSLAGHLNIVYDLDWDHDDKHVVTCSSDATAIVWRIDKHEAYIIGILHHPSFVYSTRFLPSSSNVVFTGCYDNSIRQWCYTNGKWDVHEEYNEHLGYVSALCFSRDKTFLFSGDHQGIIGLWTVQDNGVLLYVRKIKMIEIFGKNINHLAAHPNGRRLMVHTRDSQIRLVNYEKWIVTENLCGMDNEKLQMRSCLSPCGTWVFSGCEKGRVFVWNTDTGIIENALENLPFKGIVSCVDYHPYENMMAVCSATRGSRILIVGSSESDNQVPVTRPMLRFPMDQSIPPKCNSDKTEEPKHIVRDIFKDKKERWRPVKSDILKKLDVIIQFAVDGYSNEHTRKSNKFELSSLKSEIANGMKDKEKKKKFSNGSARSRHTDTATSASYINTSYIAHDEELDTSPATSSVFN